MIERERRPLSIAVVCEAQADRDVACDLSDRVLRDEVSWLREVEEACGDLEGVRQYRGHGEREAFLDWHQVKRLLRRPSGRPTLSFGHFQGKPGAAGALAARKALLLLEGAEQPPDAVLLICDTAKHDWDVGIEQARHDRPWRFRAIVIGLARVERENWVLAGFIPRDDGEAELLRQQRKLLGFDPCEHAEGLNAVAAAGGGIAAKRDPKPVLQALTRGERGREQACWQEAPLEVLMQRGAATGLSAFLQELREVLAPVVR